MSLEARNLGFYYKKSNWLFRHLNLEVNKGEIVGLQAASGWGKSTLARLIAGYENPIEGSIIVDGENLENNSYSSVQLIHQHPEKTINPRWSMEQVLNEGWQVTASMKDKLGIKEEWLTRYPNEISGGEKQRFAIARALGPHTRYLIADEISTMLDAITQVEIWNVLLEESKKRNIGLLIISHDLTLLKQLTSRIVFLEELVT